MRYHQRDEWREDRWRVQAPKRESRAKWSTRRSERHQAKNDARVAHDDVARVLLPAELFDENTIRRVRDACHAQHEQQARPRVRRRPKRTLEVAYSPEGGAVHHEVQSANVRDGREHSAVPQPSLGD